MGRVTIFTAADLVPLTEAELEAVYRDSWANTLPAGHYAGTVLRPKFLITLAAPWRGKMFVGGGVVNRIGRWRWIDGDVRLETAIGEVVIDYPQLGLRDRLRPVAEVVPERVWLGKLMLGERRVWFALERDDERG